MIVDLSTRKGYDIACALRGPDVGLLGLKWILTARLRFMIGVSRDTGGDIRDTQPISDWFTHRMYKKANEDIEFLERLDGTVRTGNYFRYTNPDDPMYMYWKVQCGILHWLRHVLDALDHIGEPGETSALRTFVLWLTTCKWKEAKQQLNAIVVKYAGDKSLEQMELDRG